MRFVDRLAAAQPPDTPRTWIYVPYDQLSDRIGPLAHLPAEDAGVVLVESAWKAARRPVHKQKLLYVLANQRHFALEQAARGVRVDYRFSDHDYATVLGRVVDERGPLRMQEAAERELRENLAPLVAAGTLVVESHGGWLTTPDDFTTACPAPPFRMDAFYRHVRRRTGFLMVDGRPAGGRFSHDGDNRRPWRGEPPAPTPPRFPVDDVTREVCALITERFADHPGPLDAGAVPATAADAEALWAWAMTACLASFGPYEDAMSTASRTLFHTRVSPLVNLHRLLPADLVADVAAADAPLNSREGFVRQVLGWREFVRHVHRVSDGFRAAGMRPGALDADRPLPPAWWGTPSGLACLDHVVEGVWAEGWSHHIPRLMVLSNIAVLLDTSPRALTDWFWVAYVDAYDWVVEPNVLGMGTFAVGELMTTKPYVAGAGYVHRMSDHCRKCAFHPKKSCPLTPLYWAFLERHEAALSPVQRMTRQLWSVRRRDPAKKARDAAIFEWAAATLAKGRPLTPEALPPTVGSTRPADR